MNSARSGGSKEQQHFGFLDRSDEKPVTGSTGNSTGDHDSATDSKADQDSASKDQLGLAARGKSKFVKEAEFQAFDSNDGQERDCLYVIDAHSLIYQVFHALSGAEMTSPQGEPVGAVHGFLRDVIELIEKHQPTHLVCAFDHPGDNFRHQIFDQYKANRDAMPDEMRPQIPNIQRLLEALRIPVLSLPNFEADDILATLARQGEERKTNVVLVTNDKDCRQLISDHVALFNIRKGQFYRANDLETDWGIRPDQVVDFQSLVGDSVDNVPGVPLIGPKLAKQLIGEFDTLQGVLNNVDKVSGKKRKENLTQFREQALMSRDLVRLDQNIPMELDWQLAEVGGYDLEKALELCQENGFRSLSNRVAALGGVELASEPKEEWTASYHLVSDFEQLAELVQQMSQRPRLVVDTETTSTQARRAEIVGYSLATDGADGYYIPVKAPEGDPQLDGNKVKDVLKPLLENPSVEKIGQNLKYDMIVLRSAGIDLQGPMFDTMVADYLIDPGQRNHGMDELSRRHLNHETIKISSLIGTGKNQKRMDEVPVAEVAPYAAEDAVVPFRLLEKLEPKLQESELADLFADVEMPLIEVLAEMEFNGIAVNLPYLAKLGDEFGEKIENLKATILELAGTEFNIDSPAQLAKILFDELDLPVIKKTRTGRSTDVEVLNQLAELHVLPAKVIEYRQFAKLKNTYVDSLSELTNPVTGRIHTSFLQDVAATGRLSSKEPNLQNIPVRTEAGRKIRQAFVAGQEDWRLIAADYSQIELRVLAHFAKDQAMVQAFQQDQDIHRRVAAQVNGIDDEQVTSEMRRAAKAINFGIIYGQSPFGLAKALSISKDEAADFIQAYFEQYPGVDQFMEQVLDLASTEQQVGTILGRKRAVHGVRDRVTRGETRQRNLPERIAINTVIQGSAADLIKLAMIRVLKRIRNEELQARLLLQIHDELVLEAPSDKVAEISQMVRDEMSSVFTLDVPLKVDVKSGFDWASCEPID